MIGSPFFPALGLVGSPPWISILPLLFRSVNTALELFMVSWRRRSATCEDCTGVTLVASSITKCAFALKTTNRKSRYTWNSNKPCGSKMILCYKQFNWIPWEFQLPN